MTFSDLFFKKIIVSQTKLRYTRQKIINNCNSFENVKNVRKKIVKIHHIHESQKFVVFHQYEETQQTSNEIIENVKTIQIHDSLHIRKKNDKTNALNKQNNYMKNKNMMNHNIFKINDDESLSINIQKINAILKIFNDDQKQYSIIKNRLHISKKHINKIIKKYHDELLQKHFEIFKTLQFLRRHCRFYNMRQKIKTYIKKCFNC